VLHHKRRIRCVEGAEVQSNRLKGPTRRAIATAHARPHILVEVDKDVETVFAGFAAKLGEVLQVGLVIETRPGMLNRLPRGQQAQAIKAPAAQAREMRVCLSQGKGRPTKDTSR
jgi:hypothetical protein